MDAEKRNNIVLLSQVAQANSAKDLTDQGMNLENVQSTVGDIVNSFSDEVKKNLPDGSDYLTAVLDELTQLCL